MSKRDLAIWSVKTGFAILAVPDPLPIVDEAAAVVMVGLGGGYLLSEALLNPKGKPLTIPEVVPELIDLVEAYDPNYLGYIDEAVNMYDSAVAYLR